jgi:hypothetical protein
MHGKYRLEMRVSVTALTTIGDTFNFSNQGSMSVVTDTESMLNVPHRGGHILSEKSVLTAEQTDDRSY